MCIIIVLEYNHIIVISLQTLYDYCYYIVAAHARILHINIYTERAKPADRMHALLTY